MKTSVLSRFLRCGTGETWHLVMLDCFDHAPCYDNPSEECGSTIAAILYFVSFYFFYAFLVSVVLLFCILFIYCIILGCYPIFRVLLSFLHLSSKYPLLFSFVYIFAWDLMRLGKWIEENLERNFKKFYWLF